MTKIYLRDEPSEEASASCPYCGRPIVAVGIESAAGVRFEPRAMARAYESLYAEIVRA